jgi:hypothetical protein
MWTLTMFPTTAVIRMECEVQPVHGMHIRNRQVQCRVT